MKPRFALVFVVTALGITLFKAHSTAGEKVATTDVMRRNLDALMNLQPYIADPDLFRAAGSRDEIQKNLDAMSGLKHVFPGKMADQEPGLAAISDLFSDYLRDIQKAFKAGANGNYVRNQLRTMTGFCLSCHTRVGTERGFEDVQKRIESSPLTAYQKAEFYAATRQFDKALKAFDQIITATPSGEMGLLEFSRAVRNVLNVSVRVKQDPKATQGILDRLSARKDIPEYFLRYIEEWRKDASQWAREKKLPKDTAGTALMSKARELIQHASHVQLFAVDPAGDVDYLRATNYLHEALQKNPKGSFRGEALYLLGACYDALQDPLLWALDSMYFEACIREFPHSAISKKCYRRFAAKLYFSYSGSSGTFVPEDEVQKLGELRRLSE